MTSSKHEDEPEKSALTNDVSISEEPNLKGDWLNFLLLLLLYIMQGLPLGLIDAVPIIIQSNEHVTYKDQVNI